MTPLYKHEPHRLPAGSRVLCLFAGSGLDRPGAVAGFLGTLWGSGGLLGGSEGLVAYYANARDFAYMEQTVSETFRHSGLTCAVRGMADASLAGIREGADGLDDLGVADLNTPAGQTMMRERLGRNDWDVLLLVFPDAIGLGAGAMENLALQSGRPAYALNGRRRLFPLNLPARWGLAWRRFLARARVMEKLLALAAWLVGPVLAAWDFITDTGKTK